MARLKVCFSGRSHKQLAGAIATAIHKHLKAASKYTFVDDAIPIDDAPDVAICTYGRLVINHAAMLTHEPAALVESNYLQPRRFVERVIVAMRNAQKPGLIIMLGSNAARYGNVGAEDYAAQKAALRKYLELRGHTARVDGIRICHLGLGAVNTAFWEKACEHAHPSDVRAIRPDPEKALTPEEVAMTVQAIIELPPRVSISDMLMTSVDYQ